MAKNDLVQFNDLQASITQAIEPMSFIRVTDYASCAEAVEAGKQITFYQKAVEQKRKDLVGPLNEEVKRINAYAKEIESPILNIQTHLKKQIVSFEMEQEKKRQAELAQAEKIRLENLAKLESSVDEEMEVARLFGTEAPTEHKVDEQIAIIEANHKEAAYDIENARTKNMRKTWKCEVLDISQVPKEFLIITLNEKMVIAAARGGTTNIPGVRLWQESSIAFGASTYVARQALERK